MNPQTCNMTQYCRFIGELFKLKMLTENIMRDCVSRLLKAKDEDSLECLCRLLTTIGKDLEDKAWVCTVNSVVILNVLLWIRSRLGLNLCTILFGDYFVIHSVICCF